VESTGDAIWSVDRDHHLVTFNSAFALEIEALTGREPLSGDPPEALLASGEAAWMRDLYKRALEGKRFTQTWTVNVGGETRSFELFYNPVLSRQGASGVVVFSRDVTPRAQTEEALRVAKEAAETANRAKSQFLASMSHELRTPLNSVIGFANILLKNKSRALSDKEVGYINRVLDNGRHLLVLINEFLDLAKIEAGRMDVEIQDVDLGTLIRETTAQLEGQLKKEGKVALKATVPDELLPLRTDRDKLRQILINLIGNGLKFTDEGSVSVVVGADPSGTPRSVKVVDTGIGIPSDRRRNIFEAFQQADAGTSRRFGGTGLGLTISRSICRLLGYELTVDSEIGKGSTFTIHFQPVLSGSDSPAPELAPKRGESRQRPLSRRDGVSVKEEGSPHPQGRSPGSEEWTEGEEEEDHRPSALVIDDDPSSRVLMRNYLEELGFRVLAARSGGEGLGVARVEVPDLIVLNLMMPGMSGWEVLGSLKADRILREVPVIVATAAVNGRGSFLGTLELLQKPLDPESFHRAIRSQLNRDPKRALVVDDDLTTRALVRRFLEAAGVEVAEAEDGHHGLHMLSRVQPEVVILDLAMPLLNGFEFLNRIRETPGYRGIPVVVITGKELSEDQIQLLERSTFAQFVKGPDLRDRLQEAIEALSKKSS
jgi:PAS domain S-box-containing protein